MTLKTKMSLLVFLTSLSIVSIGFSSWSITAETTAEINGNIEVDNVVGIDDCIYLNTNKGTESSGVDILRYYESGFINSENYIVDEGIITVYYTVDLAKCNDIFAPSTNLCVDIALKYSDSNSSCTLISKYLSTTTGYSITSDKQYSLGSITNVNNEYTVPLIFTNVLTSYNAQDVSTRYFNFSITYTFEYTGSNFKTDIFEYLYTNNLSFTFVTKATAN